MSAQLVAVAIARKETVTEEAEVTAVLQLSPAVLVRWCLCPCPLGWCVWGCRASSAARSGFAKVGDSAAISRSFLHSLPRNTKGCGWSSSAGLLFCVGERVDVKRVRFAGCSLFAWEGEIGRGAEIIQSSIVRKAVIYL